MARRPDAYLLWKEKREREEQGSAGEGVVGGKYDAYFKWRRERLPPVEPQLFLKHESNSCYSDTCLTIFLLNQNALTRQIMNFRKIDQNAGFIVQERILGEHLTDKTIEDEKYVITLKIRCLYLKMHPAPQRVIPPAALCVEKGLGPSVRRSFKRVNLKFMRLNLDQPVVVDEKQSQNINFTSGQISPDFSAKFLWRLFGLPPSSRPVITYYHYYDTDSTKLEPKVFERGNHPDVRDRRPDATQAPNLVREYTFPPKAGEVDFEGTRALTDATVVTRNDQPMSTRAKYYVLDAPFLWLHLNRRLQNNNAGKNRCKLYNVKESLQFTDPDSPEFRSRFCLRLRALVMHSGSGAGAHFTAYLRTGTKQWCYYNDSESTCTYTERKEVGDLETYLAEIQGSGIFIITDIVYFKELR